MSCVSHPDGQQALLTASGEESWTKAVRLWRVDDITVYVSSPGTCQCGETAHQGHMLVNDDTGDRLGEYRPECIEMMGRTRLRNEVSALTGLHRLRELLRDEDFVLKLTTEQFTDEMLWFMYKDSAFALAAEVTGWTEYKCYRFFARLLSQHHDGELPVFRQRVVDVFMNNAVKPYLLASTRVKSLI